MKIYRGSRQLRIFIGCCALLLAATGLHAQLTLTIDTINKTWWWTGSASVSGTVEPGGYALAHFNGGNGADFTYSLGSAHLSYNAIFNNGTPFDDQFYVGPEGFWVEPEYFDEGTYGGTFIPQGLGSPYYYGDQPAEVIGYLAGWADGMTIDLNGTPVGTVSMILPPPAAVPEPSAYALAAGFAALGCVIIRRQRSSRPGVC